jgi:hypothetical protein
MTSVLLAGTLGVCVGAAAGVACALAARRIRWERRLRRMTVCPMCSGPAEGFAAGDTSEECAEAKPDAIMTCRRVISESPFQECNFSVPRSLLEVPWLRVRGVGGTCSAGQTMWNAACFGLVDPFCSTAKVEIEMLKGWEERETNWDDLFARGLCPAATHTSSLPHPWLMEVRRAGRRCDRLVVAVSDLAGEIARHRTPVDGSYRHLLDAECHVFFVDPDNPEKDQLSVFHQFLVNVRGHRGLANSDMRIGPIAVCIPKCDRLSYFGGRADEATRFIQQLRDSGPCDAATTLGAIKRRHELVVKYAGILPCIERLNQRLQTECGPDGFRIFPMTAIGWLPDGDSDQRASSLADRPIVPWGVLDPLLWLIHASGFEALPA